MENKEFLIIYEDEDEEIVIAKTIKSALDRIDEFQSRYIKSITKLGEEH